MAETTPPISFELPASAYVEIAELAALANVLDGQSSLLASHVSARKISDLSKQLAEVLALDPARVEKALRGLTGLQSALRSTKISPESFIGSLEQHLVQEPDSKWPPTARTAWTDAKPSILKLIKSSNDALAFFAKRRDLTFAHENVFRKSRLLVDLRPIFNDAIDQIPDTVLTITLAVDYTTSGSEGRLDLALDYSDLDALLRQCERAKAKIDTVDRRYSEAKFSLYIPGRESL